MKSEWNANIESAVALRKQLHSQPEIAWHEYDTAAAIRDALAEAGITWRECAGTGTLATLNAKSKGKHIALRGDIDALPIIENTRHDYASERNGCMHACGHDGHTATLVAAARWLKKHESELSGPVTLLFQPAEEGGHGADAMIDAGALEGIDEIYGWHNWPAIPFGKLVCPEGAVMCGNGTFELLVIGKGGHASQPELCIDPVLAASAINLNLQHILSRRLSPHRQAVISVTSIRADAGPTTIPDIALLSGSFRVPDDEVRQKISRLIEETATSTAKAYGADCQVKIIHRYDATVNHSPQAARMREFWQSGSTSQKLDDQLDLPIMASEDFSYYLKKIPGAFALIGSDDSDMHRIPCHNANYDFNDRLIEPVLRLFCQLVGAPLPDNKTLQKS